MAGIDDTEYVRERIAPRPGDPIYLVLSDLLLALRHLVPSDVTRVLDYGCGGSPYRPLFKGCTYHRADLDGRNLDYKYDADSRLPQSTGGYDSVLSTQVLEHVENPSIYLRECHRVLKPKGRLLLTTHGVYEDHACPADYWRWTTFGLRKLVEENGFEIESSLKVTTGPRATLFLTERALDGFKFAPAGMYARSLFFGLRLVRRLGARRRHEMADETFAANRVVAAQDDGHDIYIVIAMRAVRV